MRRALFAFLLLACSTPKEDPESRPGTPEDEEGPCAVAVVEPTELQLTIEGLSAENSSRTEIIVVGNIGEACPLQILDLYVEGGEGSFSIGTLSTPLVQPDGLATFSVSFAPDATGTYEDTVILATSDEQRPLIEIPLYGEAFGAELVAQEDPILIEAVPVGCAAMRSVGLENVGNSGLVIRGVDLEGTPELTLGGDLGALPLELGPGAEVEVLLRFAPIDEGVDEAMLVIETDDAALPSWSLPVVATGAPTALRTERFEQPLNAKADILFAIDRSSSMDDDILAFQQEAGGFATALGDWSLDFQLAATVEDEGCINGPDLFIDSSFSASQAETTITQMINYGASYGSNTERAFMLVEAALAASMPGGCNEGLIRPDASLHLVLVADEPEQSVNPYSYYVSLFQALKADPRDLVIHAIGGDYPGGCATATAYTGAYEAAIATGGLFLSICSPWSSHLQAIAAAASPENSSFPLAELPDIDTLEVEVEGVSATTGWAYEARSNAIVLEPPPDAGVSIEVSYLLDGACD